MLNLVMMGAGAIRGHLGRLINKSATSRVAISGYALYPPEIMIPNLTQSPLFIYLRIGGKGYIYPSALVLVT